jgi:hypothetical protein
MMMLVGASLSLAGCFPRYHATTMPFRRSAYGLIVESQGASYVVHRGAGISSTRT